ncbi:MAG: glycosyltransferase family 2 protein [Gammaproteobacteria bacterium]|nr:glycosyltransferase family 2 protein [Gammaproteobacteria bacterium]
MNTTQPLISVVVPAYNEEEVLAEFHETLAKAMSEVPVCLEIVYINDGSIDNTLDIINSIRTKDKRVTLIDLSRNFGKEIALSAGLHKAAGDAVVVIDADLQDPPELIPELIEEWENGYDVVYAKRTFRGGESFLKKTTAHFFYRMMQRVGKFTIPEDTGDFRILSRRAVNALNTFKEHHRFMKGLFAWIGFKQKAVHYQRDARRAGETKWNYWHLWNFALDGITSFTIAPLKISTYIGLVTALGAFGYGIYMVIETLLHGNEVPGYPSLIVIVLMLGGIQLVAIGVLGEYLGRIFNETKQRPLYFINEYVPSELAADKQVDKD